MSGETIMDTSTTGQVSGTPRGGARQGDRSDAGVPKAGSAGTTPSASQLKNALKGEDYASQVQMLSPEPRLGPDKMRAGVDANGNRRIGREGALGLAGGNRDPEGAGVTGKVTQGDERQPETAPKVVGRRERVIHRAEGQEKREDAIDIAERFVGFDPRMLRAVGELIGVGAEVAEPPGPAFVEGLEAWQKRNSLPVSGSLCILSLRLLRDQQASLANDDTTVPHPGAVHRDILNNKPLSANLQSTQSGGRTHDTGEGSRSKLQTHVFVGAPVSGKVHPYLIERLNRAETFLKGQLGALLEDPNERAALNAGGVTDDGPESLKKWLGVKDDHTGWRRGAEQGYHRYGLAIDVNRDGNAWHPVRTGQTIGGEGKASNLPAFDAAALVVIDRANLFMRKARAELHAENKGLANRPGATEAAVARFNDASKAVADYFALAFEPHGDLLSWGKAPTDGSAHLPTNLAPLPEAQALANIERVIATVHGGAWPRSAAAMLDLIRRDLFPLARQMETAARDRVAPQPGPSGLRWMAQRTRRRPERARAIRSRRMRFHPHVVRETHSDDRWRRGRCPPNRR